MALQNMSRQQWAEKIKGNAVAVGTYREEFDPVIETLAALLEKRDKAEEQFEKSGGNAVVVHTNKSGASNLVKNPLLVVIGELNAQALAYWRDLGLTPSGLKKLNAEVIVKPDTGFEALLEKVMDGGEV